MGENRDNKDLLTNETIFTLTIFLEEILSEWPAFLLNSYTCWPAFPYPYFVIVFVVEVVIRSTIIVLSSAADSIILGLEFIPVFL